MFEEFFGRSSSVCYGGVWVLGNGVIFELRILGNTRRIEMSMSMSYRFYCFSNRV